MFNICQIKYILLLISSDCDVNAEDGSGDTPLMAAAGEGRYLAMEKLLEKGAKKDKQNLEGHSALHKAAEKGFTKAVKKLIDNKVKIDIKDNSGETALHKIVKAETGFSATLSILVNKFIEQNLSIDVENNNKETPLHLASAKGHSKLVSELLKNGADIGLQDRKRETALHKASGFSKTTGILLQYIQEKQMIFILNSPNTEGYTALHKAASEGYVHTFDHILKAKGVNLNSRNIQGKTALHLASKNQGVREKD